MSVPSSKKIRDLLKIEKSTRAVIEEAPHYTVEEWTLPNGKLHREHGPAFTDFYPNGQKANVCYYLNGEVHREDGPACVYHNSDGSIEEEYWQIHSKLHRTDGPAIIIYSENKVSSSYYLNGIEYTKEEWELEVSKLTSKRRER